jgi:hypothetical protein
MGQEDGMPIAVPVTSSEVPYGSIHSNPSPSAPLISSEARDNSKNRYYSKNPGNISSGGSGIASALGGFVVGEMLGQVIGSRAAGHQHRARGYDDGGFGAGFDIRGDTGGFDVVGDSGGGGGFDIPGDS